MPSITDAFLITGCYQDSLIRAAIFTIAALIAGMINEQPDCYLYQLRARNRVIPDANTRPEVFQQTFPTANKKLNLLSSRNPA